MSTAAAAPKKKQLEFDDAKLMAMTEPITINVERLVGGRPVPYTQSLPIKPGQSTAGMGWSKEDVKNLAEYLIAHVEAGLYVCTATDEAGLRMSWQAYLQIGRAHV